MQLSSLHLNDGADSPGLLSMNLIGGQFRMNVEHSATPRACTDTIVQLYFMQGISTRGIQGTRRPFAEWRFGKRWRT